MLMRGAAMEFLNGKAMNGMVDRYRDSIDGQMRRVEREVAAHPEAALLLAAMFGVFLGIWVKRK